MFYGDGQELYCPGVNTRISVTGQGVAAVPSEAARQAILRDEAKKAAPYMADGKVQPVLGRDGSRQGIDVTV